MGLRTGTRRRIAPALLLVIVGGIVAACGSGDSTFDAGSEVPAQMSAESMPMEEAGPVRMGEQVIRTAQVSVEVDDVDAASATIEESAARNEGFVQNQSINNFDGDSVANFTVRIPVVNLEDFLSEVSELGEVRNQTIDAQDVTLEVIDLEARISTLEQSIARLRELQQQAQSVADLVAVEAELASRQAELESLTSRRDYLANQVDLATVYVVLDQRDVGPGLSPDFLGGLQRGWDALLTLGAGLITAAGFLLPTAVVALIIVAIVLSIVRKVRTRRRTRGTSDRKEAQ